MSELANVGLLYSTHPKFDNRGRFDSKYLLRSRIYIKGKNKNLESYLPYWLTLLGFFSNIFKFLIGIKFTVILLCVISLEKSKKSPCFRFRWWTLSRGWERTSALSPLTVREGPVDGGHRRDSPGQDLTIN
jgi:hypothetical protein